VYRYHRAQPRLPYVIHAVIAWKSLSKATFHRSPMPETLPLRNKPKFRAIQAANLFLDHCRLIAHSPFVLGIQRHFRLQDQRFYVLTPRTVAWFDGVTGERLPVFDGDVNGQIASGAIPSPERGAATMQAIHTSIRNGPLPDLAKTLILDAEAALVTLRIRETLLAIGTACEVASDRYISRHGATSDPRVRKCLSRRDTSFAVRRYDLIPKLVSGRSFLDEAPDGFADIERAYRARTSVTHDGRSCYREEQSEVVVDPAIAMRFLLAAQRAIAWLGNL
jgi:hypothetical protein